MQVQESPVLRVLAGKLQQSLPQLHRAVADRSISKAVAAVLAARCH